MKALNKIRRPSTVREIAGLLDRELEKATNRSEPVKLPSS